MLSLFSYVTHHITGKDPEIICSSPEYKELKWIAGQFYWVESVQDYNVGGWDYRTELRKFVDGGMTGDGFINGVSGIVNRGCHNVSTRRNIAKTILISNVAHMPLSYQFFFLLSLPVAQVLWMEAWIELRTSRRCLK